MLARLLAPVAYAFIIVHQTALKCIFSRKRYLRDKIVEQRRAQHDVLDIPRVVCGNGFDEISLINIGDEQ